MQDKINNFKNLNIKEQKEILLIVMEKTKEKSEWIKSLYQTVSKVDENKNLEIIKEEFLKIYTFLMEAVEYIKSQKLKESVWKLDTISRTIMEMREQEKKELENQDLESFIDDELI